MITGAKGQLGRELTEVLAADFDVYGCDLMDDRSPKYCYGDVTNRVDMIKLIERVNPKIVIHTAAETDVDRCEVDRTRAMKANFEGTKNVVDGCRHVKGMLVYISTDFVFGGNRREPYAETVVPHPINIYGESKLLGEFYVREQSSQYLILRSAWLFGPSGNNFMSKILSVARTQKEIQVVQDQKGSPTNVRHLALGILAALKKIVQDNSKEGLNSVYHAVNHGGPSRYEVACELLKQARLHEVRVVPIGSGELIGRSSIVKRPVFSVLDGRKFENTFGFQFPTWQEGIADYLKATQQKVAQ